MILLAIAHVFSALLELIRISRMSDHDKDLEYLVLRYQLGIADRRLNRNLKTAHSRSESIPLPHPGDGRQIGTLSLVGAGLTSAARAGRDLLRYLSGCLPLPLSRKPGKIAVHTAQ